MVVSLAFQRVHIEEPLSIQRDTGQHAVVERALEDVGEPRVAVKQGQPMVPLGECDRGAGFLVGGEVGQVVVVREAFVRGAGADAAGDVHVAPGGVAPDAVDHLQQGRVLRFAGHVGGAAEQVGRPHGVSLDVPVIADRHVILPVRSVVLIQGGVVFGREELAAAVLDEEAGQLEIALLAGGSPELDQRQLDLRMSGIAQSLAGPKTESM